MGQMTEYYPLVQVFGGERAVLFYLCSFSIFIVSN